jgi:iron complex outermembrane receptor protein
MKIVVLLMGTAVALSACLDAAAESPSPTIAAPDDQAQETKESSGAQEETVGLQEITVTATRRSERASNVPISIAALDQSAMENLGVKDIEDINLVTPGLSYKPYFRGTSLVAIRGIYSNKRPGGIGRSVPSPGLDAQRDSQLQMI